MVDEYTMKRAWMLVDNLQACLDVDIYRVTAAFAATDTERRHFVETLEEMETVADEIAGILEAEKSYPLQGRTTFSGLSPQEAMKKLLFMIQNRPIGAYRAAQQVIYDGFRPVGEVYGSNGAMVVSASQSLAKALNNRRVFCKCTRRDRAMNEVLYCLRNDVYEEMVRQHTEKEAHTRPHRRILASGEEERSNSV